MRLVQGNEAVALAAVHAGCNFYSGYPITPATEIMEMMARQMPKTGGVFIQMEDEIGSIAAAIGAAWGGAKAMTATSGPGFSLMQENLGYACMTQTPVVVVDSQRGGPSTGLPTLPAQGEVMQARYGTHGDHEVIVLTASSVVEAYRMTVEAFNLSETYRVPAILLLDAVLSHMRENVEFPDVPVRERVKPVIDEHFLPFGPDAPFVPFGSGHHTVVTGMSHDETGLPKALAGQAVQRILKGVAERMRRDAREITFYHEVSLDDADIVLLTYGITARAAREAVGLLRQDGVKAGLLDLQTLWPFPDWLVKEKTEHAKAILVPELNLGQYVMPVRATLEGRCPVESLGRMDGELFTPEALVEAAKRLASTVEIGGVAHD